MITLILLKKTAAWRRCERLCVCANVCASVHIKIRRNANINGGRVSLLNYPTGAAQLLYFSSAAASQWSKGIMSRQLLPTPTPLYI